MQLDPPVAPEQRVVLLLGQLRGARGFTFTAPPRDDDTTSITFAVTDVPAGMYLVRVQVDGAESIADRKRRRRLRQAGDHAVSGDWAVANQRYLMAALGVVRAALERHIGRDPDPGSRKSLPAPRTAMPAPPALHVLCESFGLSPFERDLLVLCAGVELHGAIGPLCATAQADPRGTHPTFSLALAALPDAHWSAITPDAPLRRWRLVEPGPGDAITTSPLRIDERILHYLTGQQYLDERLQGLVTPVYAADDPAPRTRRSPNGSFAPGPRRSRPARAGWPSSCAALTPSRRAPWPQALCSRAGLRAARATGRRHPARRDRAGRATAGLGARSGARQWRPARRNGRRRRAPIAHGRRIWRASSSAPPAP